MGLFSNLNLLCAAWQWQSREQLGATVSAVFAGRLEGKPLPSSDCCFDKEHHPLALCFLFLVVNNTSSNYFLHKHLSMYMNHVVTGIGVTFDRVTCHLQVPICSVPTLFLSLQSILDLMLKEHDGWEQ